MVDFRFTGIKDNTSFVYRKTLPENPDAGTFYWVENADETSIYFTDKKGNLIKLNNDIITEDKLDDALREKINNVFADEDNKKLTFVVDGKNYYTGMFMGVEAPILPEQSGDEFVLDDTLTKSIIPNDEGVNTKWYVGKTSLAPSKEKWNSGTELLFSGLQKSYYTTYYVHAVNEKNGVYSEVSRRVYNFKRRQPALSVVPNGTDYSKSRSLRISGVQNGFSVKYSLDNTNWKNTLTDLGVDGIKNGMFESPSDKTFVVYVKAFDASTGEDSVSKRVTVRVSAPQIAVRAMDIIPDSSVVSFSSWKTLGKETMNEACSFTYSKDYYPCVAVPAGKSFKAQALGRDIDVVTTVNIVVPKDGNAYVVYVLPKQKANVSSDFDLIIK